MGINLCLSVGLARLRSTIDIEPRMVKFCRDNAVRPVLDDNTDMTLYFMALLIFCVLNIVADVYN